MNWKTKAAALGLGLCLAIGLHAEELNTTAPDAAWLLEGSRAAHARLDEAPKHRTLWRASVAAVVAASVLDAHSSWGKLEANPLLAGPDGRFGARSVALKGLITGGAIGAQWLLMRSHPSVLKYGAITNFAMTGLYTKVAIHNYGVKRPSAK